jgi:hypothetical protein
VVFGLAGHADGEHGSLQENLVYDICGARHDRRMGCLRERQ